MLWNAKKPNEKLQSYVIIFLWEVIYGHFYNWDRPLELVLVVYDLFKLIIETLLWSKDYSIFDTHPQHTSLVQLMLISFVWLYMIKYDVCVLNHIWIKPKRFLFFFVCFWRWFVSPIFFKIFQVVFKWKTCFLGVFVTHFMCKLNWELIGPNLMFFNFEQRVSQVACE